MLRYLYNPTKGDLPSKNKLKVNQVLKKGWVHLVLEAREPELIQPVI